MGDGSGLVYVGLKLFGVDKTRGSLEARCCTVQKVLQRTDSEPVELVRMTRSRVACAASLCKATANRNDV